MRETQTNFDFEQTRDFATQRIPLPEKPGPEIKDLVDNPQAERVELSSDEMHEAAHRARNGESFIDVMKEMRLKKKNQIS